MASKKVSTLMVRTFTFSYQTDFLIPSHFYRVFGISKARWELIHDGTSKIIYGTFYVGFFYGERLR